MKEEKNKNSVMSGLFWKFLERITAQGVSFIVTIVLARILMPEDYGIVSMVLVFITLANVFVTSGFSSALIQKKDADETDYSTMFYCSFIVSILMYMILYFLSPAIAKFYNNQDLILVLRIFALKLPITSVNSIQHAYVSRNMIFKKFFFSTIIGTIISGIIGIIMAIKGFGVWALIAQYLINSTVDTIVLFITVPWRPKLLFSKEKAKNLMIYGTKVTFAEFISVGYAELKSLIIGKIYTSEDLAYYKRGNQFPDLIINNIDVTIGSVLFPAIANYSDDKVKVKELTRRAIRISSYIIFPMLVGLCVVSKPLIQLLLTDKWLFAVPFMQISCITQMSMPISTANNQAIKALGKGGIFLKMEIIKKTFGLILLFLVMRISVMAIALSAIVYVVFAIVVNIFPNRKLLDYGYKEQFLDLLPFFALSVIMGIMAYSVLFLNLNSFVTLILQCLIGMVVYIGLSYKFKIKEFNFLLNYIKKLFGRKVNEEI